MAKVEKRIQNKRAKFDYVLEDSFLAGIALTGAETKSLRMGQGSLQGAFVTVSDSANGGELMLINALIPGTKNVVVPEAEQTRSRKLLLKRKEIDKIIDAKSQGKTVLPLEILTKGRYIKVRIAPGRGKKLYDKREVIKKRDQERNAKRLF